MKFPWGRKALCEQSMSVSQPVEHMSVMGRWIVGKHKIFQFFTFTISFYFDTVSVKGSHFYNFFWESNQMFYRWWVCCSSIWKLTFGSNLYWQGLCTWQCSWQPVGLEIRFHQKSHFIFSSISIFWLYLLLVYINIDGDCLCGTLKITRLRRV